MQTEQQIRKNTVRNIANEIMIAARTAPKAKGVDNLEILIADENEVRVIADRMIEIAERPNTSPAFKRDAENILEADALILIGTKVDTIGLAYCGLCGYSGCSEKSKYPDKPCVFNTIDLGIAIGSAVSKAMDSRLDNRIMYTVGMAAKELKLLGGEVRIVFGIPLSSGPKNIFFDRK
ncbi:MAG: ferredoxin [Bacteroidales bacterium]|nr:ferredoxin [Bacteroidales bacterium]MBN2818997.1 ferredoxin [Bacteroidales bacterium]